MTPTRRTVLKSLLAAPPVIVCTGSASHVWSQVSELPPTPSCDGGSEQTPQQTAGPFYSPNSPRRSDLTEDAGSQPRFSLLGFVLDTRCRAIPGATVEIWHADEQGEYDNSGYRWRAHQFTDDSGRWGFDTIKTRHYSFRTPPLSYSSAGAWKRAANDAVVLPRSSAKRDRPSLRSAPGYGSVRSRAHREVRLCSPGRMRAADPGLVATDDSSIAHPFEETAEEPARSTLRA
ncbi:hypothetical protein QW131_34405 [Roseibium salinum]|nr:hypothetical protein [Roseibium salinum]